MAVWWSNWTFDSNRLSDKTTDFHFADRNWHRVCHTCIKKSEADGNGTWNADDVGFSGSFSTAQERRKVNLQVAGERVKEMGVPGMLQKN